MFEDTKLVITVKRLEEIKKAEYARGLADGTKKNAKKTEKTEKTIESGDGVQVEGKKATYVNTAKRKK